MIFTPIIVIMTIPHNPTLLNFYSIFLKFRYEEIMNALTYCAIETIYFHKHYKINRLKAIVHTSKDITTPPHPRLSNLFPS